nr:MAG TPA: hypothetical protein [Caudoviricetes sp.]
MHVTYKNTIVIDINASGIPNNLLHKAVFLLTL